MKRIKVVFRGSFEPEVWDMFIKEAPQNIEALMINPKDTTEEAIAKLMVDTDFLICYRGCGRIPKETIQGAKTLKLIHQLGQGTNHIPVKAAAEMGIPVTNIGGASATSVAEYAVLLMLAVLRYLPMRIAAIHGEKQDVNLTSRYSYQLYQKTVGLVGFGNIGRWTARLLRGFDAKVIFHDNYEIPKSIADELQAAQVSLDELLSSADVVSLHVPLRESTQGMIGWEQLNKMKPSAVLINTARGAVVDEESLIGALQQNIIAGAGLDVLTNEPPSPDNPLLHMQNVIVTPHSAASRIWEDISPLVKLSWENVSLVLDGKKPHNIVTPE